MATLDEEKRSIKQYLSRLSSEPKETDPTGRERQSRIRRMKAKAGYITKYREIVRNSISELKKDPGHSDPCIYYQAFYDAACEQLTPEQIDRCQSQAEMIVESDVEYGSGTK